ncbi:response regulator [bacterium]|nr:MAG: response regulator [bacterium]
MLLSCLYIEDNIDNHFLFEFYVKGLMNLTCVENTDKAVAALKDNSYDLVLIDLNLPGSLTSWEVIDFIKSSSQEVPKIWMLSAMQQREIQEQLDHYPEVFYLMKPVRKADFVAKVKETFKL